MEASVAVCEGQMEIDTSLLPTALVTVMKENKQSRGLRAVCDGGAQVNLVLARVVKTERWNTERCRVRVGGVNAEALYERKLGLQLLDAHDAIVGHFEFLVVQNLPMDLLPKKPVKVNLPEEVRCNLADQSFEIPTRVDIVLGAGVLAAIMGTGISTGMFGVWRIVSGKSVVRYFNYISGR